MTTLSLAAVGETAPSGEALETVLRAAHCYTRCDLDLHDQGLDSTRMAMMDLKTELGRIRQEDWFGGFGTLDDRLREQHLMIGSRLVRLRAEFDGADFELTDFRPVGGRCFLSPLPVGPHFRWHRLFENQRLLGPRGAVHADIVQEGAGAYSVWTDGSRSAVYLSSSDGSDPRTNGRRYTLRLPGR